MRQLHILSLGAGVQSSVLALMFARGELSPMPDCAIFADTKAEPKEVYDWLDWLEKQLPFPVYRVQHKKGLTSNIINSIKGGRFASAPFFTESKSGGGQLRRQCTSEFKIAPITKKVRQLLGLKKGVKAPRRVMVIQYIGISLDEIVRMKMSRIKFIEHRWPLVDLRMKRADCLEWMKRNSYPEPPRSACVFCPYKSNPEWRRLRDVAPKDFKKALRIDELIRNGVRGTKEKLFLHRSLQPLASVDLSTEEDRGQMPLWNDECDGMCGV